MMDANGMKHEAKLAGWTERVEECRKSGLSVREWCTERGVLPLGTGSVKRNGRRRERGQSGGGDKIRGDSGIGNGRLSQTHGGGNGNRESANPRL